MGVYLDQYLRENFKGKKLWRLTESDIAEMLPHQVIFNRKYKNTLYYLCETDLIKQVFSCSCSTSGNDVSTSVFSFSDSDDAMIFKLTINVNDDTFFA